MTTKDLKIGNVFETADGSFFVVKNMKETFFGVDQYRFIELTNNHKDENFYVTSEWDKDLKSVIEDELDIVKIYSDFTLKNLVFERPVNPLTEIEKLYLRRIVSHYKEYIVGLSKVTYDVTDSRPTNTYIKFFYSYKTVPTLTEPETIKNKKLFEIPVLEDKMKFANFEKGKIYTLKELDLD